MGSEHRSGKLLYLYILAPFVLAGAVILLLKEQVAPGILLLLAGILLMIRVFRVFNRTNHDIGYFFHAVKNNDTTLHFSSRTGIESLDWLHESMNQLNEHVQKLKIKNEYREKYYRALIQEANTGLAVLGKDGTIELINETACRYAGISPDSVNPALVRIKNPSFYQQLIEVQAGQTITYRNNTENTAQLLLFRASAWRDEQKELKIASIQDISHEIDSAEIESYQRLISILTHEIMNAVAPLLSVSRSLQNLNTPGSPAEVSNNDEPAKATLRGLKIIEEQSNGLLNFVNNYRKLTKIPAPEMVSFEAMEWLEQIAILFSEKFSQSQITYEYSMEGHRLEVVADRKLLNQVIMNVLNNAIDALMEIRPPRIIQLRIIKTGSGRTLIRIHNNGPEIPGELQDKIFVPFFTTKENGSGIGLSLSRQIMILHKGSLSLQSSPGEGTTFLLEW